MSLIIRIKDFVVSNVFFFLDKYQDPIKATDQFVRNVETEIRKLEYEAALQISLERTSRNKYEDLVAKIEKCNVDARTALGAGNEGLARDILTEQAHHEEKAKEYYELYEQHKLLADDMRAELGESRFQLDTVRHKRDLLQARYGSAKSKQQVYKRLGRAGTASVKSNLDQFEDRIEHEESLAHGFKEVYKSEPSTDQKIRSTKIDNNVNEKLQQLILETANKK